MLSDLYIIYYIIYSLSLFTCIMWLLQDHRLHPKLWRPTGCRFLIKIVMLLYSPAYYIRAFDGDFNHFYFFGGGELNESTVVMFFMSYSVKFLQKRN